ncbi:mitochondrial phosphate carrier protein 3, mitochondrial-like isoform X6 [Iris pallida]|uniref:Mitochondrial phosphate carrier protein 3, mitochondrial-like isoform X6 n=1 Tax=Iris pallida TaxID=29817 RepID=A0AAX6HMQ1_IRIPA|nr:mitochondrial phosphate carrier protein 3, mitochondrial-like isoform X6 [Iris pallida]
MDLSEKSREYLLLPGFLYSSSTTRTLVLDLMLRGRTPCSCSVSNGGSKKALAAEADEKTIEMHSPLYYAACTAGGIASCGLTHAAVTPLDVVKCNMQVCFCSFC